MSSLSNILEFIQLKNYSNAWFEAQTGLANGTLLNSQKRGADLSSKNIEKISKRFGDELLQVGYYVMDTKGFGREGYVIVKKDKLGQEDQQEDNSKDKPGGIDHQAELAETKEELKDAMKTIRSYNEFLQEMLKTSLGKLLEAQTGNSLFLGILLRRDIDREAGGNPEKLKEILSSVLQKIGPKLNSDLKEGIGADGGSQDMKSS